MAGEDQRTDGEVLEKTRRKTRRPQLYRVILHNDDYTTMEFVVEVLETIFNKSPAEAFRIMMHVHTRGQGRLRGLSTTRWRRPRWHWYTTRRRSRASRCGPAWKRPDDVQRRPRDGPGRGASRGAGAPPRPPDPRAPALRGRPRPPAGEEILRACGVDLERLRTDLAALPRGVDRAPARRASSRSPARRWRSAACCRPRCCTSRAPGARRRTSATSWPRSSSSRSRRRRSSCSGPGRVAPRRAQLHLARRHQGAAHGRSRASRCRRASATRRPPARPRPAHRLRREPHRAGAQKGELDPLIGRLPEMQRALEVLCRRRKNNPVFVGEAGVGKTALVEGLAQRLLRRGRARAAQGRGDLRPRRRARCSRARASAATSRSASRR